MELASGDLVLVFRPDLGGRIWDIRLRGVALLFQNPDLLGYDPATPDLASLPTRAPHLRFPLWGGEKTWIAPQAAWPDGAPHRDLDSGPYDFVAEGRAVRMQSPRCGASGLQVTREVALTGGDGFRVTQTVRNLGAHACAAAPWSVMMLRKPVRTWFLPGAGGIGAVLGRAEGALATEGELACASCAAGPEYKIAAMPARAVAVSEAAGVRLVMRADAGSRHPGPAPGHGLFEVYNSGVYDYGEVEWLGDFRVLQPGEATSLTVDYSVGPAGPAAVPVENILQERDMP